MKQERIGPAREGEAGIVHASEQSPGYTTKPSESQRNAERGIIPPMPPANGLPGAETIPQWRARLVRGHGFLAVEIVEPKGPIGLIGSPLVCLGYGDGWTSVWVCRTRWEFPGDPFRIWLSHGSQAAVVHAVKLRDALARAAGAEQVRHDRAKSAYVREKFGGGR